MAILYAPIIGVPLYGIDYTVFHFLHDADVIGQAITFPVEKKMSPGLGS